MRTDTVALLWRDTRNYVQAQLAVRIPGIYCPSLFGHYGVNSTCNLRCSYCYVHEPETYPKGFAEQGLPLEQARKVLEHLREECFSVRFQGGEPLLVSAHRRAGAIRARGPALPQPEHHHQRPAARAPSGEVPRPAPAPRHRHAEHRRHALHRIPGRDGGADRVPAGVEEDVRGNTHGPDEQLHGDVGGAGRSGTDRTTHPPVPAVDSVLLHHAGEEGREDAAAVACATRRSSGASTHSVSTAAPTIRPSRT